MNEVSSKEEGRAMTMQLLTESAAVIFLAAIQLSGFAWIVPIVIRERLWLALLPLFAFVPFSALATVELWITRPR